MATQKCVFLGLVIVSLVWTAGVASAQSLERYFFAESHLGTIVELTLYAPGEEVANEAARSAYSRAKELDQIFSDYKPSSEAMRLCDQAAQGRPVPVSTELFQVLKQSLSVSKQTDGAFDVTVGPLVKLWRRARREKVLPGKDQIAAAKELVGWNLVSLDETRQTVTLERPGMRLDFGGIAKGFVAQEMSRVLRERGFRQSLVAVAGDIVAGDAPPDAQGWKVGVAPLERSDGASSRMLLLKNMAISTSGDAFQFAEIDGVRYSHIVDPKTGLGLTGRSSVTVVTRDGAMADALATAVCVLGPDRGLKVVEDAEGVAALVVHATDTGVRVVESKEFHKFELK